MNWCIIVLAFAQFCFVQISFARPGKHTQTRKKIHEHCEEVLRRDSTNSQCIFSKEADSSGLKQFLAKVQDKFYELHPFLIGTKPDVNNNEIREKFKPFNASPEKRKERTDAANSLLQELKSLEVTKSNLKTREARALASLKYFLEHNFDFPLEHYDKGLWLLGPDYLGNHISVDIGNHLKIVARRFDPRTMDDLELMIKWIMEFKTTFQQLKENLDLGVKAGMVQPRKVCVASIDALEQAYPALLEDGPEGVEDESFGLVLLDELFISDISDSDREKWRKKYHKTVKESLKEALVEGFGKPWKGYIDYLKNDHLKHCVTSDDASGLSMLPLDYIYTDGEAGEKTTKQLPTGETLDGKKIYEQIIHYYTTNNMPIDEIYERGQSVLNKYYPKMENLAKEISKQDDKDEAIKKFKSIASSPEYYFNEDPFPKGESGSQGQKKCSQERTAREHCPNRWQALQKWFDFSRKTMKKISAKVSDFFYESGLKKSTPSCHIQLVPDFNPSAGVPSYIEGDEECMEPGQYFIPFFNEKSGPKHEDTTTNGHEARPGHHLQSQGFVENFADTCDDIITWLDNMISHNTAFAEGWGLYAENPLLSNDFDLYKDNKMEEFGMVKWQLWRALRVLVDIGLHYKKMTREEALAMFEKYAWDTTDMVQKEITRYQGTPGQATSYLVGQQVIIDARTHAEETLGSQFDIKQFHFQILSQGHATLEFIKEYMSHYANCDSGSSDSSCDHVMAKEEYSHFCKRHLPKTKSQKLYSEILYALKKRIYY